MEWEGLEKGSAGKPHYYRVSLPGGRSGVNDGRGSYIKDEFNFYIEVQ